MHKRFTTPRRGHADTFVIKGGKINAHWGWVLIELILPTNGYKNYDWAGGCKQFVGPGWTHIFCEWSYSEQIETPRVRMHWGSIWQESGGLVSGYEYHAGDEFTCGVYGWWDNEVRLPVWDLIPGRCVECIEGSAYVDCTLPPPDALRAGGGGSMGFRTYPMDVFTMEERPLAWFRALWNSIYTYHQVAPDHACPIEPSGKYIFAYATVEVTSPKIFAAGGQGWGAPFGSSVEACATENGPSASGIAYAAIMTGETFVGQYDQYVHPAYSYPAAIMKNGSLLANIPVQGMDNGYYLYDRNGPPWSAP